MSTPNHGAHSAQAQPCGWLCPA